MNRINNTIEMQSLVQEHVFAIDGFHQFSTFQAILILLERIIITKADVR